MAAASILPVTIHKNKLFFLFGKENTMENSAKGWSDFGGHVEPGETPFQGAMREGAEELTGFLGNPTELAKRFRDPRSLYPLICGEGENQYYIHLFYLPYDENLVSYYNRNHRYLWERMDKHVLNDSKMFEKIEIDWFSLADFGSRRREFRPFYTNMLDRIRKHKKEITLFVLSQQKKKIGSHKRRPRRRHKTQKNVFIL